MLVTTLKKINYISLYKTSSYIIKILFITSRLLGWCHFQVGGFSLTQLGRMLPGKVKHSQKHKYAIRILFQLG